MREIGGRGGTVGERGGSRILLHGDGVANLLCLHRVWRLESAMPRKTTIGRFRDVDESCTSTKDVGEDRSGCRDGRRKSGDPRGRCEYLLVGTQVVLPRWHLPSYPR